ncbi:hypothetical protein MAC_05423 [Metarhizium acridum CQMa 102]|uniref:Single-strand DNA deaminase toxin A-like C-terminal domain-containing protein n=1 Tax=Metarhizium acridum (strain CQMa 102) TaxID=655827 RepID=E9E6C5_METAQ|nr:uncharacterized protein MAC_05423 [Metarhizium acridum CQMa 102]EFY88529.1 hypothetical protein MAC_05423 [Metarhizium acridum CQMa 102]
MATSDSPPAPSTPPSEVPTPKFDRKFKPNEQIFYFYHVIDAEKATLQSLILGPNVSNTFSHAQAATYHTASDIEAALARKTTGFLALLQPGTSPSRTILAWAESGHGHNPRGDFLDPTSSVLSNKRWTARAMKLAKEIGINMGHPYDRLTLDGKVGMFRASHVEVKLAVHAVYILLKMAAMPTDRVTKADLKRLRARAWCGGARPRFEIYFSKKNCPACAKYVRRLEELTGAEIALCWKQRLVKIEYPKSKVGSVEDAQREVIPVEGSESEEQAQGQEDVTEMQMVDLTDDTDDVGSQVSEVVEVTPEPLGVYVNGLAYCVGQMGDRGRVMRAVVGLAKIWKRQAAMRANVRPRRQNSGSDGGPTKERGRTWLATPPASNVPGQTQGTARAGLESRGAENENAVVGEGWPQQYPFVCRDKVSPGR